MPRKGAINGRKGVSSIYLLIYNWKIMFNRKLKERIEALEAENALNHEAIELLADEMGFEITECDECGCLCLTK